MPTPTKLETPKPPDIRSGRPLFRLQARDISAYRGCEHLTEPLIYGMVIFSPWAFGTTEEWSIWTMNLAGYALGVLLLLKLGIRWLKGYDANRWTQKTATHNGLFSVRFLTVFLAALTVIILSYCLTSALNPRSSYQPSERSLEYYNPIAWLPHTFDRPQTWIAFWNYLALGCTFWATWDWLQGKTTGEERAERLKQLKDRNKGFLLPARLSRILWLLSINGGLLAVEAIMQRLSGATKLLWTVQPHVNTQTEAQFGPYAYRSNAAQYFNLLWPVTLGFWWTLKRASGDNRAGLNALLLIAALMAACPIISTSRGGAMVSVGIILAGGTFLLAAEFMMSRGKDVNRETRNATVGALGLFFATALVMGFAIGWKDLSPRMGEIGLGFDNREDIYAMARPMTEDYPVFGTGPGTFNHLFQFYRTSVYDYWPAQLHNDWLETLITFGWVGTCLVILALGAVLSRWFAPGGIHGGRRFVALIWMALAGCLAHARFDFPFQIYSILFLFLLLCAILFVLTRSPVVRGL